MCIRDRLELAADPASVTCDVGVSWSATAVPYGAVSSQQIPDLAKKWFPGMSVTCLLYTSRCV